MNPVDDLNKNICMSLECTKCIPWIDKLTNKQNHKIYITHYTSFFFLYQLCYLYDSQTDTFFMLCFPVLGQNMGAYTHPKQISTRGVYLGSIFLFIINNGNIETMACIFLYLVFKRIKSGFLMNFALELVDCSFFILFASYSAPSITNIFHNSW